MVRLDSSSRQRRRLESARATERWPDSSNKGGGRAADRDAAERIDSHSKNGRRSFALSERTTFSYGSFKRFDVNTDEKIKAPEARGR